MRLVTDGATSAAARHVEAGVALVGVAGKQPGQRYGQHGDDRRVHQEDGPSADVGGQQADEDDPGRGAAGGCGLEDAQGPGPGRAFALHRFLRGASAALVAPSALAVLTGTGAEHGPAVCRIIAGWHYDCVPGRLYQFHDSVQQRVKSLAGQAVELD